MTEWVDDKGAHKIRFILKHFWLCHNFVWCVLWHHTSVYCSSFYESFFLKKMLCIESLIISTIKTGLLPIHLFLMLLINIAAKRPIRRSSLEYQFYWPTHGQWFLHSVIFIDWMYCGRSGPENLELSVCVCVCVSVSFLQPRRLCQFWWNFP